MRSPKRLARTAGILYLIIFIGAASGYGYIQSGILVPGDAVATAVNIRAAGWLFRLCFAAGIIAFLCDIAVAAIFYSLLKTVSRTLSLTAAFFRLVQTAILGMNMLCLLIALDCVSGASYLTVFETKQLDALALLCINAWQYGFDIAMVFFGLHCLLLGYLFYRSAFFPKSLGLLMTAAALAYLLDSFTKFLLPQYGHITAVIVGIAAVAAELWLCIWLLVKGVRDESDFWPS